MTGLPCVSHLDHRVLEGKIWSASVPVRCPVTTQGLGNARVGRAWHEAVQGGLRCAAVEEEPPIPAHTSFGS